MKSHHQFAPPGDFWACEEESSATQSPWSWWVDAGLGEKLLHKPHADRAQSIWTPVHQTSELKQVLPEESQPKKQAAIDFISPDFLYFLVHCLSSNYLYRIECLKKSWHVTWPNQPVHSCNSSWQTWVVLGCLNYVYLFLNTFSPRQCVMCYWALLCGFQPSCNVFLYFLRLVSSLKKLWLSQWYLYI